MPDILPFLLVALLVVVVPGVDMALVTRNTVRGGRRAGFVTTAGILAGVCMHATAAILGLSAIIAASASAYQVVKLAGAVYLIGLGVRGLLAARSARPVTMPIEPRIERSPFLEGFMTNVLNPKLAVFFLSLMPQFVVSSSPALPQLALLSAVFLVVGAAWLTVYVTTIDRVGAMLRRPSMSRAIDAISGTVLLALGLRLALLDDA